MPLIRGMRENDLWREYGDDSSNEELSGQASMLKELVSRFRLKN